MKYCAINFQDGDDLRRVLLFGTNEMALKYIKMIASLENMQIVAVVKIDESTEAIPLAERLNIPVTRDIGKSFNSKLDYILETTGNKKVEEVIDKTKHAETIVVHQSLLEKITPFTIEFSQHLNRFELLINHINDGLIVIDGHENIQLMNKAAASIIGINQFDVIGDHIRSIIKASRLPNILQTHQMEMNEKFILDNGKVIITTRIPLINEHNRLVGAFAIFKENNEVISLAEENTDLKEIKTMLEAIIFSSDEAISVVDELGKGMMINPAYTRITGLTENEVIGQPATVDISEGESMHLRVLKTRRPVRRASMKVGPSKKEVLVNVAPIIVAGKLKGSVAVIHDVSEIDSLTTELQQARQMIRSLEASYTFTDIVGNSPEMTIAIEQAKIGAKTPATVLLRGASGTGKELFAHAIHNESDRKYNKFIRVNCAAITESLLESELFGYEDGAFTGARSGGKKGIFEEANKGSIFLDEIGELSLTTQVKLLRVLQEKEIVRVGGAMPIPIDVRIIAATNVNLEKAITNKTFREDLYYRLSRLPIQIPALQERVSDLPHLVKHLITKVNQLYGRNVKSISQSALDTLHHYHWPGNIRELENVIGRAVIFMSITDEVIHAHHLPELLNKERKMEMNQQIFKAKDASLQTVMDDYEKAYIKQVYEQNDHNKTKAAKELQISVRSLYYKLEKYDM